MKQDTTADQLSNRRKKDRRKRRFSFVLRERRSGFDRRGREGASRVSSAYEQALLALRERPRLLFGLLVAVNVLNLADFLLTMRVLAEGGGEANPILRSLFAMDPLYAGLFKLVAVLLTSWLAWRCRRFRSGLEAAIIMLAVFTAVICYHIFGLIFYT
jgi:Domain of unknown function (DUF5658)